MVLGKSAAMQLLVPGAVGPVVVAPALLVLHDLALVVQVLLAQRVEQRAHAVGLEPERELELVRRHRLEVVGAVEPGRAVERPAGAPGRAPCARPCRRAPSPGTSRARTGARSRSCPGPRAWSRRCTRGSRPPRARGDPPRRSGAGRWARRSSVNSTTGTGMRDGPRVTLGLGPDCMAARDLTAARPMLDDPLTRVR